jgi:cyclopropane fatty-acyl-phospholipid synthase-like methyltransferase
MSKISHYYNLRKIRKAARKGRHRDTIGGYWDSIGRLQFDYLKENGLIPENKLLDIGCGCLRGGIHFIDYLNSGNYYGTDLSQDLINIGYDTELTILGLQSKQPRQNLRVINNFKTTEFETKFDVALALSVFTHLPITYIKTCLTHLANDMKLGAHFYATVFIIPDAEESSIPKKHSPGGIITYPDRDPYHYKRSELENCFHDLPWKLDRLVEWNHPRDQWMAVFIRT